MTKTFIALSLATILLPVPALAQTDPVDLTAIFVAGGVTIDRLIVYQIGDIVLLRGRTDDPAMSAEAAKFATSRGYRRVANLIEIVPEIGDSEIVALARHRLETAGELRGCAFGIESEEGIVRLRGQVATEMQKRFAVRMVGRIDGVREVQSALTLRAPKPAQAR